MVRIVLLTLLLLTVLDNPTKAQEWVLAVPQRATFSIASNPMNRSSVMAGNYSRSFIASTDGGVTWQESYVGELGGTSQISMLLYHPRDTMTLFAGGIGFTGLDRSTDGGMSWENVLKDPIGERFEIASNGSVTFHPGRPDTMYTIRSSPGVIFRSINRGENWDSIGIIPELSGTSRMRALAICPDPDSSHIMLVCGGVGLTGRYTFMYRSTNTGKNWASTGYALSVHPDGKGSQIRWSPTTHGRVYATCEYSLVQNISNNGGLHVSDDYGLTWKRLRFVDTSLYALEVFKTKNGDEIFVGGSQISLTSPALKGDSIIFRSVDGGTTWQDLSTVTWGTNEVDEIVANVWGFALTNIDGKTEVLMATEVGVYRSTSVTSINVPDLATNRISLRSAGAGVIVTMPDGIDLMTYVVCDILGQIIVSGTVRGSGQQRIDMSALPSAPYLVRVAGVEHATTIVTLR